MTTKISVIAANEITLSKLKDSRLIEYNLKVSITG